MEQTDARKQRYGPADIPSLTAGVDEIYSIKGKKVVHLDLRKAAPSAEELAGALIGPSGNLRAPVVRKGRVLVVGFDAEIYQRVLG